MSSLLEGIRNNYSRMFRRASIKRRSATTGLFESSWQQISKDVKAWGRIRREIDSLRYADIRFSDLMMKVQNIEGRYNPNSDEASLWFGFGSQQRSLVKIEAGFVAQTMSSGGIWTNTEFPTSPAVFHGIISGDITVSDSNEVVLPVKPLLQIFKDFPARNLTGWTTTGMTASQFFNMLRDQTDGSGSFIFRPFFQDTTTFWDIASTTNIYANLNTSGAADVFDKTVWDIIEKLTSAEDKVIFVKNNGTLRFGDRTPPTSAAQFHFYGSGFLNNEYGHTIKKVSSYGVKYTDYYSRVEVKWIDSNTITAVRVKESAFTVTGGNDPWNLGHRTFQFENFWIPTSTVADTILNNIFLNVSSLKNRIEFVSSFVPQMEVLDRYLVSHDNSSIGVTSRWDIQNWSFDDTSLADDLYWDKFNGDAVRLNAAEFKILAIELDLDKFETKITGINT